MGWLMVAMFRASRDVLYIVLAGLFGRMRIGTISDLITRSVMVMSA